MLIRTDDIFHLLKTETTNLQLNFIKLVTQLKNFEIPEIDFKDTYTSFQKIYFIISLLKKKQVLN